ncbi:hypothetical protein D3C71_1207090 [compost metagenome]
MAARLFPLPTLSRRRSALDFRHDRLGAQWPERCWAVEVVGHRHQANPWLDQPLLPQAINSLTTELWDARFSQAEGRYA